MRVREPAEETGADIMTLKIGEPLIARGDLIEDARFGTVEIIEVTRKYVWYKIPHMGTYRTSKDRALRMFEKGTAFPPLEDDETPRWKHWEPDELGALYENGEKV